MGRKKRIAFDGQVLMDINKAGIGTLAEETIESLVKNPMFEYQINAFYFGRTIEQRKRLMGHGIDENDIEVCKWFHRGIYLRMWHYLPISFRFFFPKDNADVHIFWNYDTPPGVKGKVITYVHDMTYKDYPETMDATVFKILNRNMEDTCRRADVLVTLSEYSKQQIIKYLAVPEDKIRVVPCGVDQNLYRVIEDDTSIAAIKSKYGIDGDYFLYVGTIEPRKNISLMVQAYADARNMLIQREADVPKLVLGGRKGWLTERIFESVKEYGVEKDVIFTDYLPQEDVPILMNGAVGFLFPSLYEGFGMPPLEAMACGTPVIVSDRASLPEVVGHAGMIVSVDNQVELADGMVKLALDKRYRTELSQKGLEHVKKYTWERAAEILAEICEE